MKAALCRLFLANSRSRAHTHTDCSANTISIFACLTRCAPLDIYMEISERKTKAKREVGSREWGVWELVRRTKKKVHSPNITDWNCCHRVHVELIANRRRKKEKKSFLVSGWCMYVNCEPRHAFYCASHVNEMSVVHWCHREHDSASFSRCAGGTVTAAVAAADAKCSDAMLFARALYRRRVPTATAPYTLAPCPDNVLPTLHFHQVGSL